jgi:o-succinylbenzoate---CoA ligase
MKVNGDTNNCNYQNSLSVISVGSVVKKNIARCCENKIGQGHGHARRHVEGSGKGRVDWESSDNTILLNPRFSIQERGDILGMLAQSPALTRHVWIATSGSNHIKWTAISKQALLISAEAVNTLLKSDQSDIWLNALPPFHVGGIGILARGYLSNAKIVDSYSMMEGKWNPLQFYQLLCEHQATLTALVPAQIYDLVNLDFTAPKSLRAVVVGGGALQNILYQKAAALGWNLLPSYGLTEASSQVATAEPQNKTSEELPPLKILPHMELLIDQSGCIKLKSPSLLTLYALKTKEGVQFVDPKIDGWFLTEDVGKLSGATLEIQGRASNFIKIGGESVDLSRLERILEEIKLSVKCPFEAMLVPIPDPRLGHVIHLASNASEELLHPVIDSYQNRVLPFERIRKVHYLAVIPRSPSLKVMLREIKNHLTPS